MPLGSGLEQAEGGRKANRRPPKKGRPLKTEFLDSLDSFVDRFYRWLYYFGAQLVRRERHLIRTLELWSKRRRDKLAETQKKKRAELRRSLRATVRGVFLPFFTAKTAFLEQVDRLHAARQSGIGDWCAEILRAVLAGLRFVWRILASVLNYAAPVAAVWMLIATVTHFTNFNFALSVTYQGEQIGYITNEAIFAAAEKQVAQRVVYEDAIPVTPVEQEDGTPLVQTLSSVVSANTPLEAADVIAQPKYKIAVVDPAELIDADQLADRIIRASGSEIIQASGVYISDEFKGASTNPDQVLDLMNNLLAQYETGAEGEMVHFVNRVKIKEGLYPVQSLRDVQSFESMLTSNISGESYYTVVDGDSPYLIAEKVGLRLAELEGMNPDMSESFLPGKKLLVSRSVPMMKVQVTRREVFEESIPYETETVESTSFIKGYNEITRSGEAGTKRVEANVTYLDGVAVSTTVLKETVVEEPVNAIRTVGINVPKLGGTGGGAITGSSGFIWPVGRGSGRTYISMPIWGYYGHTGTDIAAPSGTPIYAAASGTVSLVRVQYYGYGKHIQINHGNGLSTLYAHCSSLLVSPGQYVNQGDLIALVGRTGNATGNHCHFEIRQNGVALDARKYIGYSCPY